MSRKDREEFAEVFTDVTHLPGMYIVNSSDESGDVQGVMDGAAAMLAQLSRKRKGRTPLDSQWNLARKTALGQVKSEEKFFEMIKKVRASEKAAFRRQAHSIHGFMRRLHYSQQDIEHYNQYGLWVHVITQSYRWYLDLLEHIRSIAYFHRRWDGLAIKLVEHHGTKLAELRVFAVDYKTFLLDVYVYLREAQAQKFQHVAIQDELWKTNAPVAPLPTQERTANGGGRATPTPTTTARNSGCAHCKTKALHEQLHVGLGQANCPLSQVPRAQARNIAKDLLDRVQGTPSLNLGNLVSEAVASAVAAGATNP
jgi:hypothetical protein